MSEIDGISPSQGQSPLSPKGEKSSSLFLEALKEHRQSLSGQEREHWKKVMDLQMSLIQESLRKGPLKEELQEDYRAYLQDESPANYKALETDLRDVEKQRGDSP